MQRRVGINDRRASHAFCVLGACWSSSFALGNVDTSQNHAFLAASRSGVVEKAAEEAATKVHSLASDFLQLREHRKPWGTFSASGAGPEWNRYESQRPSTNAFVNLVVTASTIPSQEIRDFLWGNLPFRSILQDCIIMSINRASPKFGIACEIRRSDIELVELKLFPDPGSTRLTLEFRVINEMAKDISTILRTSAYQKEFSQNFEKEYMRSKDAIFQAAPALQEENPWMSIDTEQVLQEEPQYCADEPHPLAASVPKVTSQLQMLERLDPFIREDSLLCDADWLDTMHQSINKGVQMLSATPVAIRIAKLQFVGGSLTGSELAGSTPTRAERLLLVQYEVFLATPDAASAFAQTVIQGDLRPKFEEAFMSVYDSPGMRVEQSKRGEISGGVGMAEDDWKNHMHEYVGAFHMDLPTYKATSLSQPPTDALKDPRCSEKKAIREVTQRTRYKSKKDAKLACNQDPMQFFSVLPTDSPYSNANTS